MKYINKEQTKSVTVISTGKTFVTKTTYFPYIRPNGKIDTGETRTRKHRTFAGVERIIKNLNRV